MIPGDTGISVEDWRIRRMTRDAKAAANRSLPDEQIKRMPEILDRPEAVLWDKRREDLLYVFDAPGDPRKGKFVIEVQYRFGKGDNAKFAPAVVSGGRVQLSNLQSAKIYEKITGSLGD